MEVTMVAGATPAIEALDLYRFYHSGDDETLALRGVSIRVMPGELVAVLGPSGSGKSTLLGCLAGLDDPDGGVVRVMGERLSRRSESERALVRCVNVGVLQQSGNLLEHLSVAENIALARSLSPRTPSLTAHELLDAVGIAEKAAAAPTRLSGGQAARASLAVALANSPAVLLADEPTGEIDADNEQRIIELLSEQARAGTAVVVVTHSERLAAAADRVVRLRDGMVVDA